MEEDNQAPKQAIFSFLYGKNRAERPLFHKLRLQFVRSMDWRMRVTREECEEVGGLGGWGRGRAQLQREGILEDWSWDLGREGTGGWTRVGGVQLQSRHLFRRLFVFPDPGF